MQSLSYSFDYNRMTEVSSDEVRAIISFLYVTTYPDRGEVTANLCFKTGEPGVWVPAVGTTTPQGMRPGKYESARIKIHCKELFERELSLYVGSKKPKIFGYFPSDLHQTLTQRRMKQLLTATGVSGIESADKQSRSVTFGSSQPGPCPRESQGPLQGPGGKLLGETSLGAAAHRGSGNGGGRGGYGMGNELPYSSDYVTPGSGIVEFQAGRSNGPFERGVRTWGGRGGRGEAASPPIQGSQYGGRQPNRYGGGRMSGYQDWGQMPNEPQGGYYGGHGRREGRADHFAPNNRRSRSARVSSKPTSVQEGCPTSVEGGGLDLEKIQAKLESTKKELAKYQSFHDQVRKRFPEVAKSIPLVKGREGNSKGTVEKERSGKETRTVVRGKAPPPEIRGEDYDPNAEPERFSGLKGTMFYTNNKDEVVYMTPKQWLSTHPKTVDKREALSRQGYKTSVIKVRYTSEGTSAPEWFKPLPSPTSDGDITKAVQESASNGTGQKGQGATASAEDDKTVVGAYCSYRPPEGSGLGNETFVLPEESLSEKVPHDQFISTLKLPNIEQHRILSEHTAYTVWLGNLSNLSEDDIKAKFLGISHACQHLIDWKREAESKL